MSESGNVPELINRLCTPLQASVVPAAKSHMRDWMMPSPAVMVIVPCPGSDWNATFSKNGSTPTQRKTDGLVVAAPFPTRGVVGTLLERDAAT